VSALESRLSSAKAQATDLKEKLDTQGKEMAEMSARLEEVRELQNFNNHLQSEVEQLKERSTLNLIELCKFMKLQSLLEVATFSLKFLKKHLFL